MDRRETIISERASPETGTTLVAAVLTATVMLGFTYAYFVVSRDSVKEVAAKVKRDGVFYLAEGGVGEGIDSLNDGGAAEVIDRFDDDDWPYRVQIVERGFGSAGQALYQISSTARLGPSSRTIDALVENRARDALLMGAVQAGGKCVIVADSRIDGRDHDSFGLGMTGPGVNGVTAAGTVFIVDDPLVGGNGIAPIQGPTSDDGVYATDVVFGDGFDDDSDSAIDEEAYDGIDNDGNGGVDEDLRPYPETPDEIFNLPDGTLKRFCERNGTYFATEEELATYLATFGGEFPGGTVIYLENDWNGASFGVGMNVQPSLLIVHDEDQSAGITDLQGQFKGLIVADQVTHRNGSVHVLGGVFTFRRATIGSSVGLVSADIRHSSGVLRDLPEVPFFTIKAWRDAPGPNDPEPPTEPEGEGVGDPPPDSGLL